MRLVLALLLVLSFTQAFALEKITAAANSWPPFLDPEHPHEGVALEIIKEAYKREGYEVEMNFVPWARAIAGVKEADYDIIPDTWHTKERTEFLAYSDPYLVNEIKFIKRKGDDYEFEGLESLTGKTVGVIRDYGYDSKFLEADNFKRATTGGLMQNVKKLISGRIDLTLGDELVSRSTIAKENKALLDKIEFTENALKRNPLYVTSGLANSRHEEFLEAFNRGLASMKEDGTFDEIMRRNNLKD